MKILLALLTVTLLSVGAIFAADSHSRAPLPPRGLPNTNRMPGVDLAEGISQITGSAVSPLLGVSCIGAWRYYHTPAHLRDQLPWFCHQGAWGFAFVVLALCFFKDAFGAVAPPLIKKPLDMLELFENKASALVASTAFVPFIASQMAQHFIVPTEAHLSIPSDLHYASVLPFAVFGSCFRLLFVTFSILSFLIVWMTSHAINVLIALSPFGFIDVILKLIKTALLSSIALSYIVSPYLGAAVSLLIIFAAGLLAPTAFRFTVFGTLLATDIVLPRRARRLATPTDAHAFIASCTAGVPARTYGRVTRSPNGMLQFSYRPWLIMTSRTVQLPAGILSVAKGFLFPSLLHSSEPSGAFTKIVVFLPRYRSHEHAIADHHGITDIRDSTLTKGFKAVRAWFAETINLGKVKYAQFQQNRNASFR